MGKRIKKPAVKPEKRKDWLRRYEEDGEPPPQIAKADRYDVRTVRKQIELARQDREIREARTMVLRGALEKHYTQLCASAQSVASALSLPPTHLPPALMQGSMLKALKEHLPRSRIWKDFHRWEQLVDEYEGAIQKAKERCKAEAEARALNLAPRPGQPGLGVGFTDSVVSSVVDLALGRKGLKDSTIFVKERFANTDLYEAKMGPWVLGWANSSKMSNLENVYFKLLDEAIEWDQFDQLRKFVQELQSLSAELYEELNTIALRGVVPGRCKYCPL